MKDQKFSLKSSTVSLLLDLILEDWDYHALTSSFPDFSLCRRDSINGINCYFSVITSSGACFRKSNVEEVSVCWRSYLKR